MTADRGVKIDGPRLGWRVVDDQGRMTKVDIDGSPLGPEDAADEPRGPVIIQEFLDTVPRREYVFRAYVTKLGPAWRLRRNYVVWDAMNGCCVRGMNYVQISRAVAGIMAAITDGRLSSRLYQIVHRDTGALVADVYRPLGREVTISYW